MTDEPGWEGRRILIAALFLPVSSKKHAESAPVFHTKPITRRTSFISSVKTAKEVQPVTTKPQEIHHDTKFTPSIVGNPGLYNAVASVKQSIGPTVWIGTVGASTDHLQDAEKEQLAARLLQDHNCIPVFLTKEQFQGHYHHFCKQALWKPFHYQLPDYPKPEGVEDEAWKMYVRVNELFAKQIISTFQPGDIVWINDYHLMLVPEMVRKAIPHATIGFFLHIPFPSSELFRCLAVRKEILLGLLGADLIGFQIHSFMRHFLMTCSRILGLDSTPKSVVMDNSMVGVGSYPIGIDLFTLNKKRFNPEVSNLISFLKKKYQGKCVVIGRDKNDYVKGVRHKLLAFERFLNDHPEWIGKVVLIQVSLSTSEANESQSNVADVVSQINSKYGTLEYVPVVYLHQDISFNHYLALLTMADACLITSLRDGMNLTSHEYVVCQEEKKSPLIISEFAGTYGNFGAALRVNPWNAKEVADAIHEALSMSDEEKNYRWGMLYSYVSSNTSQQYVKMFLGDLVSGHLEYTHALSTSIPKFSFESITESYLSSRKRIFFLDDDGTLRSPKSAQRTKIESPEEPRMKEILTKLCQDPQNHVYLMSGRTRADLEPLLTIPRLNIWYFVLTSAENGCFVKFFDRPNWENLTNTHSSDLSWRKKVMEIFQYYTDRTPGSFIEEKEIGIAWHFAHTDLKFGEWQSQECQNHMTNTLQNYPIHVLRRKKCIEVYLKNVSKATGIRRILQHHQHRARRLSFQYDREQLQAQNSFDSFTSSTTTEIPPMSDELPDFMLCVGDDRSDEYMFEYLHKLSQKRMSMRERQYSHQSTVSDTSTFSELLPPEFSPLFAAKPLSSVQIYTCTVGSKSSAAKSFLSSISETLQGLEHLSQA